MNQIERYIHSITTARRITHRLLEGLTSAQWMFQPIENGQHAIWIAGHLAVADDWALISLGKAARSLADLDPIFGGSTPITTNHHAYPPPADVLRHLDHAHERFILAFDGVTDDDLARQCTGTISEFAPDLGTLLSSHVWHEGFHCGQLALIRRALGLPVCFG